VGSCFNFEDFCAEHNIILRIEKNLGSKIRGFCYYDGFYYYIILNNRCSCEQLQETVIHEMFLKIILFAIGKMLNHVNMRYTQYCIS